MRDDDAAEVPLKGARTPDAKPLREAVALPEHASAYYSPRPPPATTAHDTIETERVRLDPGIDTGVPFSERVTEDDLDPPRSVDPRVQTDAPTVLVPIVRARRRRRRLFAVVSATLVGALAGIGFGLMRGTPTGTASSSGPTPSVALALPAPFPATVAPLAPVAAPQPVVTGLAETGASPGPIAPGPVAHDRRHLPSAQRRESSASSAWFKAEPPKAWIK